MRDFRSRISNQFERAVFLDRDGTITRDNHYPHRVEDLEFLPGALDALRTMAMLPVHVIVVTNQAGIALQMFRREDMSLYNQELVKCAVKHGGRIDAIYYCPHKEEKDLLPGEAACECSKPRAGLLIDAAQDFGLDPQNCFLIGDKTSDIKAGQSVGCFSILVRTGKAGREKGAIDVRPDQVVDDLPQAASLIQNCLGQQVVSPQQRL